MRHELIDAVQRLAGQATPELTERIASWLENIPSWNAMRGQPHMPSKGLAGLVQDILQAGRATCNSPSELALALRTASAVETRYRDAPRAELVLSGPAFPPFEMRRTDEALLQLIQSAQDRLTLVSFALYRIERLSQALRAATQRDVEIRLFVEMGTLQGDIRELYGDELASRIQVYVWAEEKRPRSAKGRQGVLHAKASVSDGRQLFVSSANLTEHAMSLNIELGLLIVGGDLPRTVEQIFDTYIARGLFERLHEIPNRK